MENMGEKINKHNKYNMEKGKIFQICTVRQ